MRCIRLALLAKLGGVIGVATFISYSYWGNWMGKDSFTWENVKLGTALILGVLPSVRRQSERDISGSCMNPANSGIQSDFSPNCKIKIELKKL